MHGGRATTSPSRIRRSREPGGSAGLLALVLVATSLVIFTFSVREGEQGFFASARSVVQTIVSPVRMLGAYATAPFTGLGNVMRNLTAEEQTLSELKEENASLTARNIELEEAEQTAHRLEELLELRNTYSLQSLAARVIAGSTDSWMATVTIDKGASAGVSVGMPVSNEAGAVGQVIECAGTTAIVRLLTDEGSSVAAMVQSSRAQGMLEGSPDGTLRLALIRTDQTVNAGDVVVTSGLGGVFPKGLPVGKVATIEKNPGSTYYEIVVEPFFRPQTLEEVLIITSLTEEQQATSKDIEEADRPDLEAASGKAVSSKDNDEAKDGEDPDAENADGTSMDGTSMDGTSTDDADSEDTEGSSSANSSRMGNQSQQSTDEDSLDEYGYDESDYAGV